MTALVLAAGASRRFGTHKLLQPLGGKPLVVRSVEAALASSADYVIVVLGRDAQCVRGALAGLSVQFAPNPAYQGGISTSLRAGIRLAPPGSDAVAVLLADQPDLLTHAIDLVVQAFRRTNASTVRAVYDGVPGHPVLFARRLFPELERLTGDEGGRSILERHRSEVLPIPVSAPPPSDIDTPSDYLACLNRWDRPAR